MLADGTSLRRTARELDLCYSTLRTYKLEGLLPAVVENPQAAASVEPESAPAEADAGTVRTQALGREQRNRRDAQAPQGRATHDTQGRAETSLGGKSEQEPRFPSPASAVAGGGVLTALPVLLAEGLLAHAGKLHLPPGYYGVRSVLLTLAFLLLLRLRRVERLDTVQPGEWGCLLGLDRCPCPRTLRRRLRQLVAHPERLAAWRGALAQAWAAEDPDAVATLFVDGHVKVYTGKGRLQKQFVPRQKLCLPAATSYWTHQLGGAPLLCVHKGVSGSVAADPGVRPQRLEFATVHGTPQAGHCGHQLAQGETGRALAGEGVPEAQHSAARAAGDGHAGGQGGRAEGDPEHGLPRARDPLLDRPAAAAGEPQRSAAQADPAVGPAGAGPAPAGPGHDPSRTFNGAGRGPAARPLDAGELLSPGRTVVSSYTCEAGGGTGGRTQQGSGTGRSDLEVGLEK